MNNEEKIIAMLEEQGKRLDKMDARFDQMDQRLDQMDQRLDQMDQRLDQMDQRLDQMDERLSKVEDGVLGVRVLVDVDIDRKLKLLAEGHGAILDALVPVSRVEALETDVALLKDVVKRMSQELANLISTHTSCKGCDKEDTVS